MNDNEKNKRQRGCDGKMKHSTELAVQYHITENHKEGVEDYYRCEFCKNYHTYTLPGKKNLSHKKHFKLASAREKKPPRKMKMKPPKRNGKSGRNIRNNKR